MRRIPPTSKDEYARMALSRAIVTAKRAVERLEHEFERFTAEERPVEIARLDHIKIGSDDLRHARDEARTYWRLKLELLKATPEEIKRIMSD